MYDTLECGLSVTLPCLCLLSSLPLRVRQLCTRHKHDVINVNQFAYLKYHSTQTCLHHVIDDWYEALNENEIIAACFLDIS